MAEQLLAYDDLHRTRTDRATMEGSSLETLRVSLSSAQTEIKRLRDSVAQSDVDLRRAEERVVLLQAERQHVVFELTSFEEDLKAQRAESQGFGEELQRLHSQYQSSASDHASEVTRMGQQNKAVRDRLRGIESELEDTKRKRADLEHWRLSHDCSE